VYPHLLEGSSDSEVEESVRRSEKELEERARRLEGILGHKPRVKLAAGSPAEAILEAILEATRVAGPSLVAVGSRGLGTVGRMRLGSVSTKVVRATPGPALVYCPRIEGEYSRRYSKRIRYRLCEVLIKRMQDSVSCHACHRAAMQETPNGVKID